MTYSTKFDEMYKTPENEILKSSELEQRICLQKQLLVKLLREEIKWLQRISS